MSHHDVHHDEHAHEDDELYEEDVEHESYENDHLDHHDDHADHGEDTHHEDEHDAHGHDHHDDHEFDEHDEGHSDDEHDEEDEFEEPKLPVMNDIQEGRKDVDLQDLFLLTPITLYRKLFKHHTNDVRTDMEDVSLWTRPKIIVSQLKHPIQEIFVVKKIKDININSNHPVEDDFTLNISDLEGFERSIEPIFDIKKAKISFSTQLKYFLRNFKVFPKKSQNFHFLSYYHYFRITFLFACFALGFIFYGFITKYTVENTFQNVKKFEFSSDVIRLESDISNLQTDFFLSHILLQPLFIGNIFFDNQNITNLQYIVRGGKFITEFGGNTLELYHGVKDIIDEKGPGGVMYTQLLKNIDPILLQMTQNLTAGVGQFEKVTSLGNQTIDAIFAEKLAQMKVLSHYLGEFYLQKQQFENLLGDDKKRTYVIIFQNSDEIRPTGGFMGSLALVEVFKGKLVSFEKKDIYAVEWDLKPFTEKSPEGINKLSPTLGLRDANYWPEVEKSSQKIKEFFNKTPYQIDGILYINQNVIVDSLATFGGMYFDPIKTDVTSENFSMIMSTLVESKITKTHTLATPKQILFDFIEQYFSHFKSKANYYAYAHFLWNAFEKKDIVFYSFHENENQFLQTFGLEYKHDYEKYFDYSYPVFTSISGNKSDRYVKREFEKRVAYNTDCSIDTKLTLKQTHGFLDETENDIKKFMTEQKLLDKIDYQSSMFIQGKGPNKQYVRVYLPKNAQISPSKLFTVRDTNIGKEVSFYTEVYPKQSQELYVKYHLENPSCQKYEYKFFKQPGLKEFRFLFYKENILHTETYTQKDVVIQ